MTRGNNEAGQASRKLAFLGVEITVLSGLSDSAGHSVMEYLAPPGFRGPQPHWHGVSHEWFFVLDGELSVTQDGLERRLSPRGFVEVPPRMPHLWRNASADRPMRMLFGFDRPGMEGYFAELLDYAAGSRAGRRPTRPPSSPSASDTTPSSAGRADVEGLR